MKSSSVIFLIILLVVTIVATVPGGSLVFAYAQSQTSEDANASGDPSDTSDLPGANSSTTGDAVTDTPSGTDSPAVSGEDSGSTPASPSQGYGSSDDQASGPAADGSGNEPGATGSETPDQEDTSQDDPEGTSTEPPKADPSSKGILLGGNRLSFKTPVITNRNLPSLARPYQLILTARPDLSILLEWTDCKKLGAELDGYIILRKVGKDGSYAEYARTLSLVNYFYDKNIKANTNYYYLVVGYKKSGSALIISRDSMSVVGVRADSSKVNVYGTNSKNIKPTATINRSSARIGIGQTTQLSLIYPPYSLSTWTRWRSDDSSIASVNSSGLVTGKKVGTTLISARTPSGWDVRCTVTVQKSRVPESVAKARVTDKLRLTSSSSVTFRGTLTGSPLGKISIAVDDKYATGIAAKNGSWSYTLNISQLSYGWHYIYFVPQDKKTSVFSVSGQGIFINKPITKGPVMIVPEDMVKEARSENNDGKRHYSKYLDLGVRYSASGRYDASPLFVDGKTTRYDSRGIVQVMMNGKWTYQPTTVCQYALRYYDPSWKTTDAKDLPDEYRIFLRYADWLVDNIGADGAYRLPFRNDYLGTALLPGHTSGMTQGQVLSVLGRAYYLTGSGKYLSTGEKALDFMLRQNTSYDTSRYNGCSDTLRYFAALDTSLSGYSSIRMPEEVLVKPQIYILNGDLYALLGLYDWSVLAKGRSSATKAKAFFAEGLKGIEAMLPYYDFYGYSAYDLRQVITAYPARFTSGYAHACHVTLLKQLYDVTGSKICYQYYRQFRSYLDDPFFRQTEDMYRKS